MKTSAPTVSVIIPCYRADEFIGLQLAALAQQEGAPSFEVLLIDNGANRALEDVERSFSLSVRVIDGTGEQGTAYARNVGIAHAHGEALLFCDADDVVTRTWVRDGAAQLAAWPAFSGGAVPFESSLFEKSLDEVWQVLDREIEPEVSPLPSFGVGDYPILLGCSFGMTRELALNIGGFDRAFGAQAEDNDLGFRLRRVLGFVPAARHVAVAYRLRSTSEATFRRGYQAGMKHAMMCSRHNSWAVSPSYQGRWVLRGMKETLISAVRGQMSLDPIGRQLGVALGRAKFARKGALPLPALGLLPNGEWGIQVGGQEIPQLMLKPAA